MNTDEKTNSGPEPSGEAERKSSKPQAKAARKIILVVDDNLMFQKTIASKLKAVDMMCTFWRTARQPTQRPAGARPGTLPCLDFGMKAPGLLGVNETR